MHLALLLIPQLIVTVLITPACVVTLIRSVQHAYSIRKKGNAPFSVVSLVLYVLAACSGVLLLVPEIAFSTTLVGAECYLEVVY